MYALILSIALNVMYVDKTGLHVATVLHQSGFEIDVLDCEQNGYTIAKKRIRASDATVVTMTCKEYMETIR